MQRLHGIDAILPDGVTGAMQSPADAFALGQVEDALCRRSGGSPSAGGPRPEPGRPAISRPQPGDQGILRVEPAKTIDPGSKPGTGGQVFMGKAVFIRAARPLTADPFLPPKIAQGRTEDIREGIGCGFCLSCKNSFARSAAQGTR
jgi:hypothetical protein